VNREGLLYNLACAVLMQRSKEEGAASGMSRSTAFPSRKSTDPSRSAENVGTLNDAASAPNDRYFSEIPGIHL
jgi:hypothetical protein